MLSAQSLATEERQKFHEAVRRSVLVTRMVDYGVPLADAHAIHALSCDADAPGWDELCEHYAVQHASTASQLQQAGDTAGASLAWRAASALFQCGQLAFNADVRRKLELYEASHDALKQHARLEGDLESLVLATSQDPLYGWVVHPSGTTPQAAVVVIGGLSGWGSVYLDMARKLAEYGVLAILCEGPGQGLTRLREGLPMRMNTLPLLGAFVDEAQRRSATRIGVWGNSFGGLFAAHLAVTDARVRAVCINGAPIRPEVPTFRTAREQMNAVFGVSTEAELALCLQSFWLDSQRHQTSGTMLVLEGGHDPLVPLGAQSAFLELAAPGCARLMTWEDGEHTLYNHAHERNEVASRWFVDQLSAP